MLKYVEEIGALISLLDDPDNGVANPVIERLIEIGKPAVKILENTWENTKDKAVQEKIENTILQIQHSAIRKDLKDWVDCGGKQLLYGAFLIAKAQYPDIEYNAIEESIEKYRSEIWLELNDHLTAMEKVKVINHFLFSVHKFNRSIRGVQSPQLFFINHVLDTHKGLPISLSIIYAEIASLLGLSVQCVDLPHNFLLCYTDPSFPDDPDGIMFYINPYTKGTILGRKELEFFLQEQKLELNSEYLRPCSNIETIIRLAEGLRFAYAASRMEEKVYFLDDLIEILKKGKNDYTL
jgi:regulator of sirC expression with transglutaminase-like and TPR domain